MARYVVSGDEFRRIETAVRQLVDLSGSLPATVFSTDFDDYRFAQFDALFTSPSRPWQDILTFAQRVQSGPLSLLMLDPTAESCS